MIKIENVTVEGLGRCANMITVWVDITAPLYWWAEFDARTSKTGAVTTPHSIMCEIMKKEFTLDDFSHERLFDYDTAYDLDCVTETVEDELSCPEYILTDVIEMLNMCRSSYLAAVKKNNVNANDIWWQLVQLLPSSYNQRRTVMLNYEVLASIYAVEKGFALDEWGDFCWGMKILLPESWIFTGKDE